MDDITKLLYQLSIVKKMIYIYAVVFIFILSSGSYYLLSHTISSTLEHYIKKNLKNSNDNVSKNFYIIHFIIRFFIFFTLLKYIVKTILDLILIDLDNPDCNLQILVERISKITSITFFIVYEIVMFPLNIVNGLEKLFKVIEIFIIDQFGHSLNNPEILKKTLTNDTTNIKKNITDEIYEYYKNLSYNIDSWYIKLFIWIENSYIKSLGDENVKSAEEENNKTVNHVASSYAGFLSLKVLTIGMIYIGLYLLFKDSFILRIIIFIIILIFYIRYQINSLSMNAATQHIAFINSLRDICRNHVDKRIQKNLKKNLNEFSKDIKPLLNPLMHYFLKEKKAKTSKTDKINSTA